MAKLRDLAMQVPDLEKAAACYERCFDVKRVNKVTDGRSRNSPGRSNKFDTA